MIGIQRLEANGDLVNRIRIKILDRYANLFVSSHPCLTGDSVLQHCDGGRCLIQIKGGICGMMDHDIRKAQDHRSVFGDHRGGSRHR